MLDVKLKDEKKIKENIIEIIMVDDALRHSCRRSELAFWVWALAVSAINFSRTKTYNYREHRLKKTHIESPACRLYSSSQKDYEEF